MSPNHLTNTAEHEVTRTFNAGESIIVERRKKDDDGNVVDRIPEDNWQVVRNIEAGEDAGKVLVRKMDANGQIFVDDAGNAFEKTLTPTFLDNIQKKYMDPERPGHGAEMLTTDEKREVGHEGLESAGVAEPGAPSPYSVEGPAYQAEKRRQEALSNPTAENPHWYDTPKRGQYSNGYEVEVLGMYKDEYSDVLAVKDPMSGSVSYVRANEITHLPGAPQYEIDTATKPRGSTMIEVPQFESAKEKPTTPEAGPIDKYGRLRELLPPVTRPEGKSASLNYASFIYIKDEVEYRQAMAKAMEELRIAESGPEAKDRKYYDEFVTEENKEVARQYLGEVIKANPGLVEILNKYGLNAEEMAAVDAIRENADVRFEVAKLLAEKLDRLVTADPEGFGARIAQNSANNLKVDHQTGARMYSRDYAVSLALKMIDGQFSERKEDNAFARDNSGRVINGQHRHAARTLLSSRF